MRYEIGQANRLGNRNINQDRFDAVETDEGVLLILADGMGGRPGGELAAQVVVDTARKHYKSVHRPVSNPESFMRQLILDIHENIKDLEVTEDLDAAPGSTGVLCLIQNGEAQWAHIGDSRLYLFRNGIPLYRTTDHSYVEQLYKAGKIERSELTSHPQRSYITQCLGCMPAKPHPEVSKPMPLQSDDVILMCSDGLWGVIDDAQLGVMLSEGVLDDSLNKMAEMAESISYPNSDNVSAIALRFYSADEQASTAEQQGKGKQQPQHKEEDQLKSAIQSIEDAIREYGGEIHHDDKDNK